MRCSNYFQNRAPFASKILRFQYMMYKYSKLIKNDGNIRSLPFCRYLIIGFHAHAPKSQSAVLRKTWILHKHYCPLKRSWGVKPKILAMFVFHCYSCKSNIFPVARWLLCGQGFVTPKGISQYVVVVYFKCILPSFLLCSSCSPTH